MEIFEVILLMLSAVFLSNILNRFLPTIAIPLIQIVLGIALAIPLTNHSLELSPELFLLLFIAPLLFNDGVNVDKKAIWRERKSILSLSIGLVFVTVGLLGGFIHLLLPTLPLAAAFALAAALAPTDAVAVGALAEKVKVPHKIMHTLEGESLINDASGLVSFQFAVAALMTGTFSLFHASTTFIIISIGGILLGAVLSFLKIALMRRLRELGIENSTSFILMEVLLPFLIFVIAEKVGVNGILAVVSGGIVHSLSYKKLNVEIAQLNLLSKNTWSVITFSLNGLVFVLLGTQIPSILQTILNDQHLEIITLLGYIFAITIALLGLRFMWILLFNNFQKNSEHVSKRKIKDTLLYTVSGVRGTITLVSVLSLPLFLSDGTPFEGRDLLLFIAAGVILTTLLLANFTLHLFAPKVEGFSHQHDPKWEIGMLREVKNELRKHRTAENKRTIGKVIKMYNDRIFSLSNLKEMNNGERKLRQLILEWQMENTLELVKQRRIRIQLAFPVLRRLNKRLYKLTKEKKYGFNSFYSRLLKRHFQGMRLTPLTSEQRKEQRMILLQSNSHFITENLKALEEGQYSPELIEAFLLNYERMGGYGLPREAAHHLHEWIDFALHTERNYIQTAFEKGEISRAEMRQYRENLLAIESSIQIQD
ncbi:cation:proton antiporter [Sporosarcina gallistercoris]|uniref:Sodium:proton antiporter n=1 Tax=Sporosarcina gallistercoris TaxID=2762245 RepID=A0ABR8PIZ6_9BACL|nr:sodium:proton antiporter [Sporosarcina gallistercoris]MBD7908156.1 sodium:proton antiporter [Sporosarcina gallistercoris]